MKRQILKLAKRLNRFNFSDIQTMSELEEAQLTEILNTLISENNLKLNGSEYFYISNKKTKKVTRKIEIDKIPVPQFHIDDLLLNDTEKKIYNNLSENVKNKVYKYLVVLKNAGEINGVSLKTFLLEFEKRYPKYKMALSTFHRLRKLYQENGLLGIIPKHRFREPIKNNLPSTPTDKNKFELLSTIQQVKGSDLYLPVLLVVSLGLKIAEVEPLYWSDIDTENSEINIDKMMFNGEIIKYTDKPQKRICKIPTTLSGILKEEKEKVIRMFGSITDKKLRLITNNEELSFDILRKNYIRDLIEHKIPISIISDRLGFCSTREFMEYYGDLVDRTDVDIDSYDPLAM